MEKRKKISLWLLLFSLAQTPLATASADAHSPKKKATTHQTSKKVEKKSAKKSKKKNHSVASKSTHKDKHKSGKHTNSKESITEGTTIQSGRACIYSNNLHGSATATGERFNKNALTAAHLHLPLGSRVRVTSVETGKSVVVRINDRGPYAKKFILDMSPAAAQKIGLSAGKGTMAVKIQKIGKEKKAISEEEEVLAAE
jgi:rare lipoprotein A